MGPKVVGLSPDAGSSLLCYPSAALQKLVPSMDQTAIVSTNDTADAANNDRVELLTRPVMLFVLQQHDLQHLQFAMKQALRRAACRVYAMQALNWLLRSVTQPICLHDLLWWFVASLTPIVSDSVVVNEDDNRQRCLERRKDHVSWPCGFSFDDPTINSERFGSSLLARELSGGIRSKGLRF
jgi:E3 ubiquitin-protein ligase MYCBP2